MISIIIPTLNEEEGIAKVLCSIPEEIRQKAEIIVVDISTDYTPVIAQRLGAKVVKAKEKICHQNPTEEYLSLIISNAKKYRFPTDYVNFLESIKTK